MQKFTLRNRLLAVSFSLSVCVGSSLHAQNIAGDNNSNAVRIERNETTHLPKTIYFSAPATYKLDQAQQVFNQYLDLGQSTTLQLISTQKPPSGIVIQRYAQWYQGIKVDKASVVIAAKNGVINLLTANVYKPTQATSVTPAINEATALNAALDFTGAQKYMWQDARAEKFLQKIAKTSDTSYFPKGTLVWIEGRGTGGSRDGQLHLAYCFNIYAKQPLSRNLVYVDAQTGKVIFQDALLKHTAATGASLYSGTVGFQTELDAGSGDYILYDVSRGDGIITATYGNSNDPNNLMLPANTTTSWTPADQAIDAHWGATKVFDYWYNVQNRYSIDGMGMEIISGVNYDTLYDNAFWNGAMMSYGDGSGVANGGFSPLTSMDVCAHEMGHGICQYTANLDYYAESGAMNESLSDIWGAVIENWSNPHENDAQAKETWEIGEEIGATPMRSMANPKQHGQPDTYGGANWVNVNNCGTYDNCGVHTNSGIGNHWFYLISQGGNGINDLNNSFFVNAIGITKAADIVYTAESVLQSNAQYADFRSMTIAAAQYLYGTCSPEEESVTRAWYAVGVGSNFVPCTPQLSFGNPVTEINENNNSTACPSSKIVNIPLKIEGPAIAGGTANVTVSVVNPGNAVNGVDYVLSNNTFTFGPSSPITQNAQLTVYDNGSVDTSKSLVLGFTITANGSNLSAGVVKRDSVIIVNDDHAPEVGGDETHTVGLGGAATSNLTSPFASAAKTARTQYVITVAEMQAAGMRPGVPVVSAAFNVTQKNSTIPFSSYTVKMKNTTQNPNDMQSGFIPGAFTTVYSGSFSTVTGWNTISFTNNFTWDGVSNVGVEICFNNTTSGSNNDQVAAVATAATVTAFNSATFGSGACSLPYSTGKYSTARPLFRFVQTVPPSPVEATANSDRSWDVHTGQHVYFYSTADAELIAGVDSTSADLGCTAAAVTVAGNGFTTVNVAGTSINRSVKEFSVTPTTGTGAGYKGTFFFLNTELNGMNPASLWLVRTSAASDTAITASNTDFVMPTSLVQGQTFTGFRGNFTGFGRYFLTDNGPLAVNNLVKGNNSIQVKNNPFTNVIHVGYNYQAADNAQISLTDISGKTLYKGQQHMNAGGNSFDIDLSHLSLAPGYYMLQITTSKEVSVHKMLHD
ncbi:M4 family metallopeptidase [Taibaiella soli]|uniref:Peptidase M4 n=1 Tax=Taibaiella soli TaxID=1649169 RepID=A0A2W2B4F6_9BACT|nr:M4 family metallopeptidase [Taibaiella soli]PZF71149.1 hypothetical protein DN068_19425 [Taibaiella soli]